MVKTEKRSGSYSVRVSLTDADTGVRTQKRVTARTKRELDAKVAELKASWNSGTYIEPDETPLAEYIAGWLETSKSKPATKMSRAALIRNHIANDPIGAIPLGRLKRYHVQDFVNRKAKANAPGHVGLIYTLIRRAVNRAVVLELIARNPCTAIELPTREAQPHKVFNEDETRRFAAGTADDDLAALWLLAVSVGLRRGELIGLRWSDIDFERGTLTVARTQTRTEDCKWIIGDSAKSGTSHRTIKLPLVCLAALRHHRVEQVKRRLLLGADWQDTGAVFDFGDGRHIPDPDLINRRFRSIIRALALPTITPHGLRHTAATNALRRGVPVHVVAQMLGHADPSITLRVYAHVLADMQLDAATRIDAIFEGEPWQRTGTE